MVDEDLEQSLKALYQKSNVASAMFDWFSTRERDSTEIKAKYAAIRTKCDVVAVRDLFKEFEEIGCGRYLEGRRGFDTRFQFDYSIRELAKVAIGKEPGKLILFEEGVEVDEEDSSSSSAGLTSALRCLAAPFLMPALPDPVNEPSVSSSQTPIYSGKVSFGISD